jgi:hypothetical protein
VPFAHCRVDTPARVSGAAAFVIGALSGLCRAMQPETADAILASTQAGCPVPRFLGNKALTSTGDVSYTLGNNDHEDLDDAPGFALWLQRSAELERWQGTVDGWGLLFAWTSLSVRTPLPRLTLAAFGDYSWEF